MAEGKYTAAILWTQVEPHLDAKNYMIKSICTYHLINLTLPQFYSMIWKCQLYKSIVKSNTNRTYNCLKIDEVDFKSI